MRLRFRLNSISKSSLLQEEGMWAKSPPLDLQLYVKQAEAGICHYNESDSGNSVRYVTTTGAGPCVVVAFYDPTLKKGGLYHSDSEVTKHSLPEQIEKERVSLHAFLHEIISKMQSSNIDVTIVYNAQHKIAADDKMIDDSDKRSIVGDGVRLRNLIDEFFYSEIMDKMKEKGVTIKIKLLKTSRNNEDVYIDLKEGIVKLYTEKGMYSEKKIKELSEEKLLQKENYEYKGNSSIDESKAKAIIRNEIKDKAKKVISDRVLNGDFRLQDDAFKQEINYISLEQRPKKVEASIYMSPK